MPDLPLLLAAAAEAAKPASALAQIWEFFVKGGPFMAPIAACSLAAVSLMLLRWRALRREMILPAVIERELGTFQPGDSTERLARLVGGDPAPLSRIARVALAHLREPRADNLAAVETAARVEIHKMEGGLSALELIVGIGPMLGLLGAVSGLVRVFANLGAAGANTQPDPLTIALGIAEALNTTIVGLAVAIPSLVAFTYFSRRVESLATEMEAAVTELLSKCYQAPRAPRATFAPADTPAPIPEAAGRSGRFVETYRPGAE